MNTFHKFDQAEFFKVGFVWTVKCLGSNYEKGTVVALKGKKVVLGGKLGLPEHPKDAYSYYQIQRDPKPGKMKNAGKGFDIDLDECYNDYYGFGDLF